MKRREAPLEPELEALLNPGRIERHAPPEVRARALARGRAIIAAGGRIPPISTLELLAPAPAKPAPPRGLVRLVLPTSIAAAIAGIGAVATLRSPPAHTPTPAPSAQPAAAITEAVTDTATDTVQGSSTPPEAVTPPLVAPPKSAPSARPEGELAPTELQLLGRAQTAYTHRDFARAISLVSELTRRFPNGHLAEEREALRVRSLLGAGRTDEGRRAAAAFAVRFPRSVLLPKEAKP
jgi:hypothetical protein